MSVQEAAAWLEEPVTGWVGGFHWSPPARLTRLFAAAAAAGEVGGVGAASAAQEKHG